MVELLIPPRTMDLNSSDGIRYPPTRETYEVYLKKLAFFSQVPYQCGEDLPKEIFCDSNIANFLASLGSIHEFKPHVLKASLAAIGMMGEFYGLPKIFEDPTFWKMTTRAIKVF